jgi:2-C-methyl-D-erythritol 2,4-cyclodiphosphate synthase
LGGITIPYELGLDGHSDADALTHAIMDALLGAAGLGDIGLHFPDTDAYYKNISSLTLLGKTNTLLRHAGWRIINIDTVIVTQKPKLAPYFTQMAAAIAQTLEIDESAVNIKATTEEGLGFTGKGLGLTAQAVCLIMK